MTDYENILISAIRYALGRRTYVVGLTVDYTIKEIKKQKISNYALTIILNDIRKTKNLGAQCDKEDWMRLLNLIETKLLESNS